MKGTYKSTLEHLTWLLELQDGMTLDRALVVEALEPAD